MRAQFLLMISLLAYGSVMADVPEGQTLGTLSLDFTIDGNPAAIPATPVMHREFEWPTVPLDRSNPSDLNRYNQAVALKIDYFGKGDLQQKLYSVPGVQANPVWMLQYITANNYAIVGEVKYENISPGSFLEMWSFFHPLENPGAPSREYFTRTLADNGPMGKLEGTHDWREFWLPFDSTGAKSKVIWLEMNLHLTGPGTVHLRNMRLVQYPDNGAAPLIHIPSTSANTNKETKITELIVQVTSDAVNGSHYSVDGVSYSSVDAIEHLLAARHEADPSLCVVIRADKKVQYNDLVRLIDATKDAGFQTASIAIRPDSQTKVWWIGGGFFLLFGVTGIVIIFLVQRSNRRRHERELRRIASLDS